MESQWNFKSSDSLVVFAYSNCERVELLINNRSFGKMQVDKNTHQVQWPVSYQPGILKIIGYNGNKKITEHSLKTASEAVRMDVKISKSTIKADGKDMSFLEISVVDKNNTPVFDADDQIEVKVSGEGVLAGIDTGDMFYTGLFKSASRKAFHGKLMVSVKSSEVAGKISVHLSSEKVGSLQLDLESVK
jgi:beta-galactosidase